MQVSPLTEQLASYIANAGQTPLTKPVQERAKLHFIDTLAAMISGSHLVPGEKAIAFAKTLGGKAEAGVVGTQIVTSPLVAALTNGMLAHADETDDTHPASDTHPGRNVIPAAMAIAEQQGASGAALLNAIVLGYDFCARTTLALKTHGLKKAGHYVGPFGGIFGAAAAAGALLKLDKRQSHYLLSYAAQQAAGLLSVFRDPEHVQKSFVGGGMPAHNGALAALFVANGFTGAEEPFAGEGDFFTTFSKDADRSEMTLGLGTEFAVMQACIKCWSAGGPTQGPLHVLRDLIKQYDLKAEQVASLVAKLPDNELVIVDNRDMPNICVQHLLAVMLIEGTASFHASHDLARMKDPNVLRVRERIQAVGDASLRDPQRRWRCVMEITLTDGRILKHQTMAAKGSIENPVTRQDEEEKALDLMVPILGQRRSEDLIAAVWKLDELSDVRELRSLYMI